MIEISEQISSFIVCTTQLPILSQVIKKKNKISENFAPYHSTSDSIPSGFESSPMKMYRRGDRAGSLA